MDTKEDNNLGIDDIYEDFEDFDLGNIVEKYKKENEELRQHAQSQELNIQKLVGALEEMQKVNESLTKNISTLFKTAKSELERKEGIIADLRTQRDNTAFRRRGTQFQTNIDKNINIERVDNVKNEVIDSNVKNEATSSKEVVVDTPVYSEGEITDEDVHDIKTDRDSDEKAFSDKYNKQTRENWRQDNREQSRTNWHKEGNFRDRYNNSNPKNRYNMFQRRFNNDRELDYQKNGGKFGTNKENDVRKRVDTRRPVDREEIDTRRPKSREYAHFQELDTRRYKEIDTYRDNFKEIDTRRPKSRDDFQEIDMRRHKEMDVRRPNDREDTLRGRDKSNHRRNEDSRLDRRKNDENKRCLIRHNPRRDSSSYLSPTRRKRRHKSESDKTRSHTPPLQFLPKSEDEKKMKEEELVPKRTDPVKNFFTDHLDNILESIQSNVHDKITFPNPKNPNPTPQLETIFSDDNFSQEEEIITKTAKVKNRRKSSIKEYFTVLFDDSQLPDVNKNIKEEEEEAAAANKIKSKKKHKKHEDTEVDTNKSKLKKKSKLDVSEKELKLATMSKFGRDLVADDEDKDKMEEEQKLATKKRQGPTENSVSDSIEKLKDYDDQFASPLKRYIKKCKELSEESTRSEINDISEQEKMIKNKKKRNSKDLEDIIIDDIQSNSKKAADIEYIEAKRKRKSKEIDDDPHQMTKKPKLLKITSPRKSFSPLEDIYNEEDAGEIKTKKDRRFKQSNPIATDKLMLRSLPEDIEEVTKKNRVNDIFADDLNSCLAENVTKEDSNSKKKSKSLEDTITKTARRSKDILDDSFEKNSTFAVRKRTDSVDDSKCQKESTIKSFTVEEINNSQNAVQELDEEGKDQAQIISNEPQVQKIEEGVALGKLDEGNQTLNDLNNIQEEKMETPVQKLEEEVLSKKRSYLRGLDEEIDTKNDKNQTLDDLNEIRVEKIETQDQKLEEGVVSKKKSSSRRLDKEMVTKEDKNQTLNDLNNIQEEKKEIPVQKLEEVLSKKRSYLRGLDEEIDTKNDKNQTLDDLNEIRVEKIKTQAQKLEEGVVSKKKSSSRGLDNEAVTKKDKNQTLDDLSVQKLEEGEVLKKKSSSRGLDKEAATKKEKNHTLNDPIETPVHKLEEVEVLKKKSSSRGLNKEAVTKEDTHQIVNALNETPVQKLEEEKLLKKKNSSRGLDNEDATKKDKNQSLNDPNETPVHKLEEGEVLKKKSSSRGLDNEAITKEDKNQTQNEIKVEKKEERIVPKKKSSPGVLDKEDFTEINEDQIQNVSNEMQVRKLEETMAPKDKSSPERLDKPLEEIVTKSPSKEAFVENSLKNNDASNTNNKLEAERIDSFDSSEELNKSIEVDKDSKKIVIVSDILLHSGKPKYTENGQHSLPVHLNLPNLIKLETIIAGSKENPILEKEANIDLPKVKTSKSVSRKDRLLERYASENSQSKLNSSFSDSISTDQSQEGLLTEEKVNRKRKGPEEAVTVPKKRKVDLQSTEIEEGIDKEKQIDEIERKLQLMHKSPLISGNNIKKKEEEEEVETIPKSTRKRRGKGSAAVRKSPRNLNLKTPELVEKTNDTTTTTIEEATIKNTEDVIKISTAVLPDIKSRLEDLETDSNKTETIQTNVTALQLDFPNISTDNKAATEQKTIRNTHHLPPSLGNIPVTSASSPIRHLGRKRITPTPVKDSPVCSFQNILEKNKSDFKIFSKNIILESDLNLTDDGEIPILHLEENHFNNMEDATQKTFDKSIMKLLDCMNVSNLDCDISKITEKATSSSLSFENVIDKASNDNIHSTPVKNPLIPVSSTPRVDINDQTVNNGISKTEAGSNSTTTSVQAPVRFRRRCRIVAVKKV
ncbi:unnamed protein product [Psylliodes chrysocephalus]|uniref:Uncharacterized protein n=1 Tax=Psylliodes chrysocephalus TaxID=3402493 RepID=A0A9P0GCW6_9CUCU|nr:unnamed protein product [Psylliodes chrysocephala]